MQGPGGIMYFGTPLGLSMYDGASFNNYDVSKGFQHNIISGIAAGPDRKVYIFTNSSHYYQPNKHNMVQDSCAAPVSIKKLCAGKEGRQYACTYSGLYLFKNGLMQKLPVAEGNAFPHINCVVEWQDSLLVVGRSFEPVDIYNMHTWQRVAGSQEKLFVRDMLVDAAGNLWLASIGSGVCLLPPGPVKDIIHFANLPAAFIPFRNTEFRAIVQDRTQNIWMASINHGLIKYNARSGEFLHITMEQGLASNTLFALCCDNENNIWIGTNQGLQKLNEHYLTAYTSRQGLPADLVLDALPLPSAAVLTCGYSGVGYIHGRGRQIQTWQPPLDDEYFTQFASLDKSRYGLSLRKLIEVDISSSRLQAKKIQPLPAHYRGMVTYHTNKLLLGGDSSILVFESGKLNTLTKDQVRAISCMALDSSGFLWTGSLHNVINGYKLEAGPKQFSASFIYHYAARSAGAQDYMQCLCRNKNGLLLYGTGQSGIGILSVSGNKLMEVNRITTASGLGNNNVLCMQWYNDSILLAGTGSGIDEIIFSVNGRWRILHLNDYYNFSNTVYCIRENEAHHFLLGTEAGLFEIPTLDVESFSFKNMPVAISAVSLIGRPDSLLDDKLVELSAGNRGISISYSSPCFINEKITRYTYLLEGSQQHNWSNPSGINQVNFIDLPPGHYRFMVKAINVFGEISAIQAVIEINIQPAFWQRWWFYLVAALALVLTLYLTVRKRIKNIRHASAVKNKIAETEMMALRAQMNPHFVFNCMNIIDGLITGNRREEAQNFLQKFSKLIRLVLENSQHQLVPLQLDIEALKLYTALEAVRYSHEFSYRFEIDKALLESHYKIPPLLLQPYVENAIVHGLRHKESGGGIVALYIKKKADHVAIVIEDNGIGRAKARAIGKHNSGTHQPIGLNITGKRIDLLKLTNGDNISLTITDLCEGEEPGTRVLIQLPLEFKFR